MPALQRQFFLGFAFMGCVMPFMSKLLADRGLSDEQVGYILGANGLAIFISPWLVTTLADHGVGTRRLLAGCFLATAACAAWIGVAHEASVLYVAYLLMCLAWVPAMPLQDGLYFKQAAVGGVPPYPRIRVWGTIGFVTATFILWVTLTVNPDANLGSITILGAGAALLGAVNACLLPKPPEETKEPPAKTATDAPAHDPKEHQGLSVVAALRACLHPQLAGYLVGQLLLAIAVFGYHAYLALYLARSVGLADQWLGLIVGFGVAMEIGWILILDRLIRRFGQRKVIVIGTLLIVLRLLLLALFPNPVMATLNQFLHGPMILVVHVCPVMVLNQYAPARARGSIQGVYATGIIGTARLLGAGAAGHIAALLGYTGVMGVGAAVSLVAALLFFWVIKDPNTDASTTNNA